MTDVQLTTAPDIMVVIGEGTDAEEHQLSYADMVSHMDSPPEPGMIGDDQMVELVARYLDRPVGDLGDVQVTRPEEGHILIGPKFRFGV